ncbi:MAG: tRNA pseudouridine(55) synthase TruB [Myxococcota bacterium]
MARADAARGSSVHGAIIIDKPVGPTSFAVMRQVERRLGAARAGHAGTLDPLASGVLVVLLGEGTKLSSLLMDHDKTYRATIALGQSTATLDADGLVTGEAPVPALDEAAVRAVLDRFVGAYDQIPPAYSAIKKDGRSLMSRARAGETDIPLEPRAVVCHGIALVALTTSSLTIDIACGKGFYVRSLARDVAQALGTLGHIAALRRTRLGAFDVADAVLPDAASVERVLPLTRMVPGLANVALDATDVAHVRAGRAIAAAAGGPDQALAVDPAGTAVAWIRRDPAQPDRYRVERGFVPEGPGLSALTKPQAAA